MPQNSSLLDRIKQLIDSGNLSLPVYNPLALQLQQMVADCSEDAAKVEKLIGTDQALAADVLRVANSPFYCGLSSVRTIRSAIVRLGIQQVQRLVVLASEQLKYRAYHADVDAMLRELWRHASTTALAAQWLADRLRSTDIEEVCFLGGLLHDIGKLIILRAIDEIKKSEGSELLVSPALLSEILISIHCELGYKLLQGWNLPDIYCCIVRDHHSEELSPANIPLAIVRLANESSRKLGMGLDPNPDLVLAATPEANLLKTSEILLAELEVMLEDHLSQAGMCCSTPEKVGQI
jgi:putative nucleotidyltransferase with HDIG domain